MLYLALQNTSRHAAMHLTTALALDGLDSRSPRAGAFHGATGISIPPGLQPDYGPDDLDPSRGMATVGAVPFVVNYNVLLITDDMQLSRQIARAISSRGGGLPSVEAMALPHEGGNGLCSPKKVSFLNGNPN